MKSALDVFKEMKQEKLEGVQVELPSFIKSAQPVQIGQALAESACPKSGVQSSTESTDVPRSNIKVLHTRDFGQALSIKSVEAIESLKEAKPQVIAQSQADYMEAYKIDYEATMKSLRYNSAAYNKALKELLDRHPRVQQRIERLDKALNLK